MKNIIIFGLIIITYSCGSKDKSNVEQNDSDTTKMVIPRHYQYIIK